MSDQLFEAEFLARLEEIMDVVLLDSTQVAEGLTLLVPNLP
jgi:hypothetical protein